ncbi:MAG: hypothetical protein GDA38_13390 [Hormoscilla sp. SP12CHS1]|nr:hypothetical protein [Hormoscilla sp. SP12CHS1]
MTEWLSLIDINILWEFSRNHCIAICAFLVPVNLLATLLTMILVTVGRPRVQVWWAAGFASLPAIAMFLHVLSWFIIGVVMAPTYILFFLGCTCLLINFWVVIDRQSMSDLLRIPYLKLRSIVVQISG